MMRTVNNQLNNALDEVDSLCTFNLNSGPELNLSKWWFQNQQAFPYHFRLAMDVLCTPSSSTAVERANSEAGREFSAQRLSLSSAMFSASMCVRSWTTNGGLEIPHSRAYTASTDKKLTDNKQSDLQDKIEEEVQEGGLVPLNFPLSKYCENAE